ncbi:expressed unknown protein [Seminavis robusta]|uniref:RING-type domain-containing protein n=1 Tax=Seminavis robusta TaxID=568900 RepID=A0A9N8DTT7_9STRA|nr:expressed unknown protein [Seminavis robusta]|eukprot:Sro366_g127550.1 n/a (253) ;mRNA; f:15225-16078
MSDDSSNDDDFWDKITATMGLEEESKDKMPLPLFMIILAVVATCCCGTVFYLSLRHEREKEQKRIDRKVNRGKMLTKCLQPRKWDSDASTYADTESASDMATLDDDPHPISSRSLNNSHQHNVVFVMNNHKGKGFDQCQICEQPYSQQCTILQSNNHNCGHIFHKECMEKWLNYEHLCPICLNVFALQDPTLKQNRFSSNQSGKTPVSSAPRRNITTSSTSHQAVVQHNITPAPPMPSLVELPDDAFSTIDV